MSARVLQPIPHELIYPNPFQVVGDRRMKGPEFDALVDSIRVNGVQQPPPARPHPTIPHAVQLHSGHRRRAAAQVARPDQPFEVILEDATDIQMLEHCAEENLHRSDINDIERAHMIEAYKQLKPDATNADMARVFRLNNPASVTNIRKFLRLPAPIQDLVAAGTLPDAYARQLVGVASVNPKAAIGIAEKVAAASKSDKAHVFAETLSRLHLNQMRTLNVGWSMDWLAEAPVTVERDLGEGEHLIGACAGCVFNANGSCARPACFEEKFKLYILEEATRVSAKLKVPVLASDEKATVLFDNNYGDDDRANALLNSRKEVRSTLRIIPFDKPYYHHNYLSRVLDAGCVTLGSTDPAVCREFLTEKFNPSRKGREAAPDQSKNESDAQRAKRIEQEEKELAANRAERSVMWKSKYDAIWLVKNASVLIGARIDAVGAFLKFIETRFCKNHSVNIDGLNAFEDELEKGIKANGDNAVASVLRKQHIVLCTLCRWSVTSRSGQPDYKNAHSTIVLYCKFDSRSGEGFGVTLPDGWDVPPIHKTHFNCWECGKFAGNTSERLTKRNIEVDGWIDDGKAGVFCSLAHKTAYLKAQGADAKAKSKDARSTARENVSKVNAKRSKRKK